MSRRFWDYTKVVYRDLEGLARSPRRSKVLYLPHSHFPNRVSMNPKPVDLAGEPFCIK